EPATRHRRRVRRGHREHLRQVRLQQPRRQAPDGELRGHARGALPPGGADVAARRGLRGGGARPRVGYRDRPGAGRGHRPRGALDPGGLGRAPGAEPRVQGHEGGGAPLRRGRVRRRLGDRGPRACPGSCAHGRRDGPCRPASPAGLRAARAVVARAEPRSRRLRQADRQHAGPRQPLVQAVLRRVAQPSRGGRRGPLAVPLDDAARAAWGL
ncbi:MAG: hypothetical protein AVDCRST_MAG53-2939, partial [uncultured Solirubrobacteraceae bacterium]